MTTVKGQDWKNFLNMTLKAADSDPKNPLTDERRIIVENRVNKLFHRMRNFQDHPTYAWMIISAIKELNEETGSSEEAISSFIKKEFNNLPWFHVTYLKKQLNTLCDNGEIRITHENLYMLSKDVGEASQNLDHSLRLKQQRRKSQYGKRGGGTPKNTRCKKAKKVIKEQGMEALEVEKKKDHKPIILRFRMAKQNTTDVGTSCSNPKSRTLEYEELVIDSHPKLEKGKDDSQLVQLGRGQRKKGKMDQNQAGSSTPRPNGRPPRYKRPAVKNETKHTPLFPPQRSDKNAPIDRPKMSIPTSSSTKPNMADMIQDGIIIALPAQARLPVKQKAKRGSNSKV